MKELEDYAVDKIANKIDVCTVGGRIKYYRIKNKLLQEQIYIKVGIDRTTYVRYENNSVHIFNVNLCIKICKVLNVDKHKIFSSYMLFIDSDYVNKIKTIRKSLKMTQKDLSILLNMNSSIIKNWESGKIKPSEESYNKLKKELKKFRINL